MLNPISFIKVRIAVTLAMLCLTSAAQADWPKTVQEYAMLPKYCAVRLEFGGNTEGNAQWNRWVQRMHHENFIHVHHYCNGIDDLNKAAAATDNAVRQRYLRHAITQFEYMEDKTRPNFLMRPEIATQKGRTYVQLGNLAAAKQSFEVALKHNPRYVPAYAYLADMYAKTGKSSAAVSVLKKGLGQVPNSAALKKRLQAYSR